MDAFTGATARWDKGDLDRALCRNWVLESIPSVEGVTTIGAGGLGGYVGIRILLVGLAPVFGDMLAVEADVDIVEVLSDRAEMLQVANRTAADVVILALDDGELPQECLEMFEAHPRIKIVGVAARGRQVYLYDLRPFRSALGEVSPSELVDAIRRAIRFEAPPRPATPS